MNNPFEGKAVKFDTAEQLEHLADLARGYGLTAVGYDFNLFTHTHFREHFDGKEYSNYRGTNNLPEIRYSDFIASLTPQPDMVNHPDHYQSGSMEVIDVIESFGLNFRLGNVIKYILRADKKGNKKKDLQKAVWYLQREIDKLN